MIKQLRHSLSAGFVCLLAWPALAQTSAPTILGDAPAEPSASAPTILGDAPSATPTSAPTADDAPPATPPAAADIAPPATADSTAPPAVVDSAGPPAAADAPPVSAPPASDPPAAEGAPPAEATVGPAPQTVIVQEKHPNGALHIQRQVIQDPQGKQVNHGRFTAQYPSGVQYAEGQFVNGKRHGKWTRKVYPGYAGAGTLFSLPYYQSYASPFLSEAYFVNGVLDGFWTIYDKNGVKISEWSFQGGKPHGPWIWYTPQGKKERETAYADGLQHGEVVVYQNGKPTVKEKYDLGHRIAWDADYYNNGSKYWEGWHHYGKENVKTAYDWWEGNASTTRLGYAGPKVKHGKWTWWYPDGTKQAEGAYALGKEVGQWTWFHPNGRKWIAGPYNAGKLAGKWSWWQPDGVLEKEKTFSVAAAGGQPIDEAIENSGVIEEAGGGATPPADPNVTGATTPAAVTGAEAPPAAANTPPASAPPASAPPASAPPADEAVPSTSPPADPPAATPPVSAPTLGDDGGSVVPVVEGNQ